VQASGGGAHVQPLYHTLNNLVCGHGTNDFDDAFDFLVDDLHLSVTIFGQRQEYIEEKVSHTAKKCRETAAATGDE
jgi:hypothetical protein